MNMMDKQKEAGKQTKSIEVKGMQGVSIAYIQRFFGHVGPVEEVKKVQDLVVVRFKNQSSINKALRYSGRIIDKQPIKIRPLTHPIPQPHSLPTHAHRKPSTNPNLNLKQQQQLEMYTKLDEVLSQRVFDITFYWVNALKLMSKLHDDRNSWLLHEIFFQKMSQIIHYHAFGTNPRSMYAEITIKEHFITESKSNIKLTKNEGMVEKLQILSIPSNQLLDQPNFQCFLANVETKLRYRFNQLLKPEQSARLYQLYSILNAYSLHIPTNESIFASSDSNISTTAFTITKQLVTQSCARISLQHPVQAQRKSEYREIDTTHFSKEIEILSDSCLNDTIAEYATYDIFRDDFDGSLNNNCAVDVFFQFKVYIAANYVIVRCREQGKMHYFRLDFQLRLVNCEGEILNVQGYGKIVQYKSQGYRQGQRQVQGLKQGEGWQEETEEVRLLRHTLVITDIQNIEKSVYLLENYVRFFLSQVSLQSQQKPESLLAVMIILTNPPQTDTQLQALHKKMSQNPIISKSGPKLFSIKITDCQKFQRQKCSNFIQEYVDQHRTLFNFEIARFHARKIIEENQSKFGHLRNVEEFVTQTIWKLEQEKSKKEARNRVKIQLHNVRYG